jgi:hypothetical protein
MHGTENLKYSVLPGRTDVFNTDPSLYRRINYALARRENEGLSFLGFASPCIIILSTCTCDSLKRLLFSFTCRSVCDLHTPSLYNVIFSLSLSLKPYSKSGRSESQISRIKNFTFFFSHSPQVPVPSQIFLLPFPSAKSGNGIIRRQLGSDVRCHG